MKFQSSTLFVNTGRKPLPGMQKKKKNTKNNIALGVCIAIITVLCIFVGMIVHVWLSYNEDVANEEMASQSEVKEVQKEKASQKKKTTEKKEAKEAKETKNEKAGKTKSSEDYETSGMETKAAKAAIKEFDKVSAEYSFGILNLADDSLYIKNTGKIENTAALAPFLAEYVSDAIYLGRFDYTTDVSGYQGSYLMDKAFGEGSVDAANLLIEYFGSDRLNSYFASEGYANTYFGGSVGSDGGSYTASEDLVKLMKKFYNNTSFFPYSDMYKKMQGNTVDTKIMKSLPSGAYGANMSFTLGEETVDAAIVYTSEGNFIFVAMAEGNEDEITAADKAMANSAKKICENIK